MSLIRGTTTFAFLVLLSTSQVRALQTSVKWIDDVEAGVDAARRASLPNLFLVLPAADAPPTVENKVPASFRDPGIARLVTRRFVAVRLRRSSTSEVLLKRLDASDAPDGSVVIATPGGSGVDMIAPDDVQDAKRLAPKLAAAFGKYQDKVLAGWVAPVLENKDAKPDDLLKSLQLVQQLELLKADEAIAKLLDRKELAGGARSAAYDTLAALSTGTAVAKLLDAALKDTKAADALRLCTPAGAAALIPAMELDQRERLVLAYDAVIAICSIDDPQPPEFWQSSNGMDQSTELNRISVRVSACLKSWREARGGGN